MTAPVPPVDSTQNAAVPHLNASIAGPSRRAGPFTATANGSVRKGICISDLIKRPHRNADRILLRCKKGTEVRRHRHFRRNRSGGHSHFGDAVSPDKSPKHRSPPFCAPRAEAVTGNIQVIQHHRGMREGAETCSDSA